MATFPVDDKFNFTCANFIKFQVQQMHAYSCAKAALNMHTQMLANGMKVLKIFSYTCSQSFIMVTSGFLGLSILM